MLHDGIPDTGASVLEGVCEVVARYIDAVADAPVPLAASDGSVRGVAVTATIAATTFSRPAAAMRMSPSLSGCCGPALASNSLSSSTGTSGGGDLL